MEVGGRGGGGIREESTCGPSVIKHIISRLSQPVMQYWMGCSSDPIAPGSFHANSIISDHALDHVKNVSTNNQNYSSDCHPKAGVPSICKSRSWTIQAPWSRSGWFHRLSFQGNGCRIVTMTELDTQRGVFTASNFLPSCPVGFTTDLHFVMATSACSTSICMYYPFHLHATTRTNNSKWDAYRRFTLSISRAKINILTLPPPLHKTLFRAYIVRQWSLSS